MKWITWVGVALMFGLLALVAKTTADTNGKLDVIAAMPQKARTMDVTTRKTTWKSATGMQEIITYQERGETDAAWAARHKAKVVAAQAVDPIVP